MGKKIIYFISKMILPFLLHRSCIMYILFIFFYPFWDFSILLNNSYWLLGFIEGEGTFGFKNFNPYFSVRLHSISKSVLDLIKH